jgi:hypothetical protein
LTCDLQASIADLSGDSSWILATPRGVCNHLPETPPILEAGTISNVIGNVTTVVWRGGVPRIR